MAQHFLSRFGLHSSRCLLEQEPRSLRCVVTEHPGGSCATPGDRSDACWHVDIKQGATPEGCIRVAIQVGIRLAQRRGLCKLITDRAT